MKKLFLYLFIFSIISFAACKKEEAKKPVVNNAQEQITTVYLSIVNQSNVNETYLVKWKDLDGDGGNAPSIDTISLKNNNEYKVDVLILDESKNPVDTISSEIEEEADAHRFFFTASSEIKDMWSTTYLDFDSKNRPLGLSFKIKVNSTNTSWPVLGKLNVVLSHYDGVEKDNNPSSESDLDINFPVRISM